VMCGTSGEKMSADLGNVIQGEQKIR